MAAFQCGAGIYCGTFLLSNNWDYRLMFLAFTVPLLTSIARDGFGWPRRMAMAALLAVVVSCWHIGIWNLAKHLPFGSPASVALDEGCNWLVFWGLMFVGGFTLGRLPDRSGALDEKRRRLVAVLDSNPQRG